MKPVDKNNIRHYCQDEGAQIVNGNWMSTCVGGLYFWDRERARTYDEEKRRRKTKRRYTL